MDADQPSIVEDVVRGIEVAMDESVRFSCFRSAFIRVYPRPIFLFRFAQFGLVQSIARPSERRS